jgi:hypothetical protein
VCANADDGDGDEELEEEEEEVGREDGAEVPFVAKRAARVRSAWADRVLEWAVKEGVLRAFGDSPAGTSDLCFCCWWKVCVIELEAAR